MGFGAEFLEDHYTTETTLSQKRGSLVLLVRSAEGGCLVRRELAGDRRALFARLKSLGLDEIPPIAHIFFDGEKTVVLETFIDGTPLSHYIDEKRLPASFLFPQFAARALSMLQTLHGAGIIHRDLKPEHFLLTEDGGIFLIDFGIARLYAPGSDRDTEIQGTRRYAPPEQFGVTQTDPRSDLYALSRTLEEFLPLAHVNFIEKSLYRAWLVKGAAFDPNARYKNAAEMRAALLRRKRIGNLLPLCAALLLGVLLLVPLRPLLFPAPETPQSTEATETAPPANTPTTTPQTEKGEPAQEKPDEIPIPQTPPKTEHTRERTQARTDAAMPNTTIPDAQKEPRPSAPETSATPPITTKPQGGVPSLVLADGESDASTVSLAANATAAIRAENENGTLTLSLSDNAGHQAEYSFSYRKPPRNYPSADSIDAEIHLIDMNGDGILDIVPILARRQSKGGFTLIDGASCWGVAYSPESGFFQVEGTAFSTAFKVYPDGVMDNDMFVYSIKDGKLESREF